MRAVDPDTDPLASALSALPVHELGRERAAQIRSRAHRALDQASCRRRVTARAATLWRHPLEPAAVAVASAVYLAAVVRTALDLYGF